jgi:uncharacterized membrane protein YoaK (UPF0700 family)
MKSVTRRGLALSACLAGTAGFVDAIGFLETGGLFVSFMSGNSTQAGIGLLEGDVGFAVLALGLVASFVLGVTAASSIALRSGRDHRALVVAGGTILLAIAAGLEALDWAGPWTYTLVAVAIAYTVTP